MFLSTSIVPRYLPGLSQPLRRFLGGGGEIFTAVRSLHLLTTLLTLTLIYLVSTRLMRRPLAGALAAAYFAGLQVIFVNILFYFEVIQGLLYVAAVWFLLQEQRQLIACFISGVLFGLAFLTKQQALLPAAFVLLWLLTFRRSFRPFMSLLVGIATPIVLTWALYAAASHWDEYLFWNFTFNAKYASGGFQVPDGDFVRRMILSHGWMVPFALLAVQRHRIKEYSLLLGIGLLAQASQFPRPGEMHAAAGLPMIAAQFGVVTASLWEQVRQHKAWRSDTLIAVGAVGVLLLTIGTNVLTSFIPSPAGFRRIIGLDDLRDIASWLEANANESDTLYIFPETDSTSQIHPLSGLLPPHTWATGNRWGLAPSFVVETLLKEWTTSPPTWIVWFPDLADGGIPDSARELRDFVLERYEVVKEWKKLPFYGDAAILRLAQQPVDK